MTLTAVNLLTSLFRNN